MLDLPKLDDITQVLLCKRHGPKAGKSKYNKLYSQPEKTYENFAFKGQAAARMGLIINAYLQQALGNLMEKLNENEPNMDLIIQMVRDIFAMSVKVMDQTARTGAFHHLIRRKATVVDTGLEDITELNDKFMSLKLTSEGVLGKDFEEKLKSRSETNKQIRDLLPELSRKQTNNNGNSGLKRKINTPSNQDTNGPKYPKTDNYNYKKNTNFQGSSGSKANDNLSGFRIPKVNNSGKRDSGRSADNKKSSFRGRSKQL